MRMIDGMPLVEAEKPVTIHITETDCERGSKKDPRSCAAALALKRDTACDESRVHLACTYLRFGDKWLRYATPPSLKAEIISFDRGGGFYPGAFRLHPMAKSLRLRPAKQKTARGKSQAETGPATARKREALRDKYSGDRLLIALRNAANDATTGRPAPSHKQTTTVAKKVKAEPRVFHRVKGVRERASTSKT